MTRKKWTRWSVLNGLLGATIIDVHEELAAACGVMIRSGRFRTG